MKIDNHGYVYNNNNVIIGFTTAVKNDGPTAPSGHWTNVTVHFEVVSHHLTELEAIGQTVMNAGLYPEYSTDVRKVHQLDRAIKL